MHFALLCWAQLRTGTRNVKHVDRHLALSIYDRYLYVAPEFGKGGADAVKQPWAILRSNFEEGTVR